MLWNENWIYPRVGYVTTQTTVLSQNTLNVGGDVTFRFDAVVGNTGYKGRYLWKLATNLDNEAAKCYEWYTAQPSASQISIIKNHQASQCPRRWRQAASDRGFRFSGFGVDGFCYKQRATWFFTGTSISFHVTCCYDYNRFALIRENNPSSNELSTHTYISLKYNWLSIWLSPTIRRESRQVAVVDDNEAFDFCCIKSPLCKLFEAKRPMAIHGRYIPPWLGKSFWIFEFLIIARKLRLFATNRFV